MEQHMKANGKKLKYIIIKKKRKNDKANGHGILIHCDGDTYNGS